MQTMAQMSASATKALPNEALMLLSVASIGGTNSFINIDFILISFVLI